MRTYVDAKGDVVEERGSGWYYPGVTMHGRPYQCMGADIGCGDCKDRKNYCGDLVFEV